jgi:hypothetical protein
VTILEQAPSESVEGCVLPSEPCKGSYEVEEAASLVKSMVMK